MYSKCSSRFLVCTVYHFGIAWLGIFKFSGEVSIFTVYISYDNVFNGPDRVSAADRPRRKIEKKMRERGKKGTGVRPYIRRNNLRVDDKDVPPIPLNTPRIREKKWGL